MRLHDTAHTFGVGHRIRLMVAGACFPRRSRHLHTTKLGTLAEAVVAEHTVHHDPAHPSRLVLCQADRA